MMISVIIPFFNEEDNLPLLQEKLTTVLGEIGKDYEIVLIDDGSLDDSLEMINEKDKHIKVIKHRKQMGKGKALLSGFRGSKGDVLVFMDADLQDDPDELPKFIEKIDQGYDLVNGWREKRHDNFIKTLPSLIGNRIILKNVLNSSFHDINCGFKALRREILNEIKLYGDNFRFLPVVAEKQGFKTTEIPIKHNERHYGKSKYGFFKRFSIFADIFTAYFLYKFSEKPLHFFASVGGMFFIVGFLIDLYLTIQRLFFNHLLYNRPLLNLGMLLIIVGIQIIMTGVIAELIVYLNKNRS
jgi:glycosyltransferase involved in cell wall biosynthesis